MATADELTIEYVPLSQALEWEWERNPKKHDVETLARAIQEHGFRDPPIFDTKLKRFAAGNGRVLAVKHLFDAGEKPPRGIAVRDDGEWLVPVMFGVDAKSRAAAEAFAVDHNNVGISGSGLADAELISIWRPELYAEVVKSLESAGARPVSIDDAMLELILAALDHDDELPPVSEPPNPRKFPIDMIYTLQGADGTCCLAVRAGLKYGIQSGSFRLCPYVDGTTKMDGHDVAFIDNDFKAYDHERHVEAVRKLKPKYATVRDAMTRAQCKRDQIEHFELEQILEWAEELDQYAENVIVIPKYTAAIARIPEKFVLGFSIPSSHGGTEFELERFKGRKVHLLGGSWKKQIEALEQLGDDVVSVDNNYVTMMAAKFANFVLPDGTSRNLSDVGFEYITNPRYVALALSFGAIGAKLKELFSSA